MSVRVRLATAADAPAIARLHVNASAGPAADQGQQWLAPARSTSVFVAVDRAEVVGFAHVGPSRDADAGLWTGELYGIYVRPESWGSAAGRGLWSEACAALCRAGTRATSLWVPENNPRARRFFEREGGRPDGSKRTETQLGVSVTELRYRAPLSALTFAEGFASALDRLDDEGLARFLDPSVTWAGGAGRGQEGVLAGLRSRIAAPPEGLEHFSRSSTVTPIGGDRLRVQVAERLREGGHAHLWRHALALTIPAERGVLNVVPLDLPGEPARLATYLRRVGIYR